MESLFRPGAWMTHEEAARRFYEYVWPHRAMVLRTARFLVRNAAEAEDLAQEALMRAFRKIEQFNVESNAKAWLSSILRHVRIDQKRRRASGLLSDAESLDSIPVAAAASATTVERDPQDIAALLEELSDQSLIDALRALPEDICWTLLLVDVEQMSYEAAAEVMDIPEGTVKSRLYRGRKMVRDALLATKYTQNAALAP
jgi:RNA polymerase sigma-70 factor (ECF subfamily)